MSHLYEEIRDSVIVNSRLCIEDFEEEDYNELYYFLLDELKSKFKGDYFKWYEKKAWSYHKYRVQTNNKSTIYTLQKDLSVEEQTIREQLAVIKFYLKRDYYGSKKY